MASTNNVDLLGISRTCRAIEVALHAGVSEPSLLYSRESGAKFLTALLEEFERSREGETLVVDFNGVKLMDASFADEALATLALRLSRGDFPNRFLVLENLSDTATENLEYAVSHRPEREERQVRNLVVPILRSGGKVIPIGKLEAHLKAAWDFVSQFSQATARELSMALGLEVSAASTKLKTLFDLRLIRRDEVRDESGKQFVYRSIL